MGVIVHVLKQRTHDEDLDIINEKSISCPSFTKYLLNGANHTYDGKEEDLAIVVSNWIKSF